MNKLELVELLKEARLYIIDAPPEYSSAEAVDLLCRIDYALAS